VDETPPMTLTRRQHGYAAARWVWWATLLQTGLVVSVIEPRVSVAVVAGLTGVYMRVRGSVPFGWLVSAPLGLVLVLLGWERFAILLMILGWLYAAVQFVRWDRTTLHIDADHLEIVFGVLNQQKVQVPRRQLAQLKESRWPWAKLFGYTHVRWETAAQVEFQDRIRYVDPEVYRLLTDRDELAAALGAA